MPSLQKGFLPIPMVVMLLTVGIAVFGGYWFFSNKYKSNNAESNQSASLTNETQVKVKEDKKINRLTEEELNELHQIDDKLKEYSDSRLIFTSGSPSTDPKWWGHWNITESDLKNKNINLNSAYQNQVINGVKNFSIIQNGYESIDLNKNKTFMGVSKKFIEIFEGLVIKANIALSTGKIWADLAEPEKSVYLLANPSADAKLLKDSQYLDAFKIAKAYILKQNAQNVNEIMSICNSARLEKVKYECYFQVSVEYVDDFDCNLIREGIEEYRQICFAWKGIYNQDKSYCKLAESRSNWCESQINTIN